MQIKQKIISCIPVMWIVYEKHDAPLSFPSSSKTSLKQSQFLTKIIVEDLVQKKFSTQDEKLQIAEREVLLYHIVVFGSNTSSN